MALHALAGPDFWLALAGVVVAWFFYLRRPDIPAACSAASRSLYTLLDNKYYFDWFNENVLARGARRSGAASGRAATSASSTASSIDGSARTIGGVAALSRRLQSGYLYWYALVMIVGVIGLMTWQLWPFLGGLIGAERARQQEQHAPPQPRDLAADPRRRAAARVRPRRPRRRGALGRAGRRARRASLVTIPLVTGFDIGTAAMQFVEKHAWIARFNVWYTLGVDGLSVLVRPAQPRSSR